MNTLQRLLGHMRPTPGRPNRTWRIDHLGRINRPKARKRRQELPVNTGRKPIGMQKKELRAIGTGSINSRHQQYVRTGGMS